MTRTLLCLVRHGETNWNRESRFQGQLDIALNLKGRLQAAALGRELSDRRFDAIYSSDLGRAVATAEPHAALRGMEIRKIRELREKHDGAWHALTHAEIAVRSPEDYKHYLDRRADYSPPGGESLMRFAARVRAALTKIAEAHPGGTILVVAHAGVGDIAYRLATGKRLDEPRKHPVLNAAPNWIAYEDGAWTLVDWAKAEGREMTRAPFDGLELPRREAARALLVDPEGRTLLLRFSSDILPDVAEQGYAHFWGQPGGALEAGESFAACARRELYEETGFSDADVGEPIASREFPVRLRSGWAQAVERYFLVRCAAFEPKPSGRSLAEQSYVLGWRWWRKDEIAAAQELIYPEGLAHMLEVAGVG